MRAQRGEVEVVVTTAKELRWVKRSGIMHFVSCLFFRPSVSIAVSSCQCSGAQLENLNGALANFLKGGEVIKLTTAVDPALIGGMTVR